jgi:outer membrane protein assembly factor BamD (BamD/ComL family)
VRRLLTSLIIFGVVAGLSAPAWAKWVWRDGRWIYVETAEPALPEPKTPAPEAPPPPLPPAPKAETPPEKPAPKPETPAPKPEAPAPKPETPATHEEKPAAPKSDGVFPAWPSETVRPGQSGKGEESLPWWKRSWGWGWGTDDKLILAQGKAELAAGNHRLAASTLSRLIKNSPTSPLREEAMWLRATALIEVKEYYQAFEQYEELITQYAGSPHYREAMEKEIQIGELFLVGEHRKIWGMPLMIGAESEGLEILRKVYEHQPAGEVAAGVVLKIADYHWAKGSWMEAEDYYDKYCREYPNGDAVLQAELRRAKCAIERCRGARYDTTVLQLAYDRLRQFQAKFPDVADKENVPALVADVRNRQAQALYEIAARYHRAGQVLAAAYYAERLRERFPDSSWNAIAARFLAETQVREEPTK